MPRTLQHPAVRLLLLTLVAILLRKGLLKEPPGFGESDLLPSYVYPSLLVERGPEHVYLSIGFPSAAAAPPEVQEITRRLVGDAWYPTAFLYHPWVLYALVPVVRAVSLGTFEQLLQLLDAAAAVAFGLELARWLRVEPREGALLALVASLATPFADATALGQNTIVACALALRGLRGVFEGRPPTAIEATLLLVASFLKPWAVLLLGVPAFAGQLGVTAALGAAWLVLAEVLPPLVLPPALWAGWHRALGWMANAALLQENNGSLRCFLTRLNPAWHLPYEVFPQVAPQVVVGERVGVALVALAALALVVRRRPSPQDGVAAGLALVLVPLSTLWVHYTVLLLPGTTRLAWTRTGALRGLGAAATVAVLTAPQHTLFLALVPADSSFWKADPGWALAGLTPWIVAVVTGLGLLASRPAVPPSA